MGRRGTSFVELMVALGVFLVVIGMLMAIWTMGSRMGAAANLSGCIQSALIIQENLLQDIHQMVLDPAAAVGYDVRGTGLTFRRAQFDHEKIKLVDVRWQAVSNRAGLLDLVRTEGTGAAAASQTFGDGLLARVEFRVTPTAQLTGPAFDIQLVVLESARNPSTLTHEELELRTHRFVARVPTPSSLGIPFVDPAAKLEVMSPSLLPLR